ncbi:hypothetical protein [Candidatus Poriferisodalis sp.]|uniref:hypothetical protein n=1 Tax=Candidatus Poriferisodalis sp. TaxID=3101277 RepID=UPI003C6ED0D4
MRRSKRLTDKTVHELNLPRWRNKHAANEWLASLERYAFARIGEVPCNASSAATSSLSSPRSGPQSRRRHGEPLSWQALLKLLRTYELDTTVHGFRSAFKTWCIEQTATP